MRHRWIAFLVGVSAATLGFSQGSSAGFDDRAVQEYQGQHDSLRMNPSYFGYQYNAVETMDAFSSVAFGLNAGFTLQLVQLDFTGGNRSGLFPRGNQIIHATQRYGLPQSLLVGVSGTFRSSFDFRAGQLYSDPVVSTRTNPEGELFAEALANDGSINSALAFGVGHESNGQYLNSQHDDNAIATVGNGSLANQYFASMGWDYLYLRASYNLLDLEGRSLLLSFEPRFYLEADPQDTLDFTSSAASHVYGIDKYDRFRSALTWEIGATDHVRLEYTCGYFENWGVNASLSVSPGNFPFYVQAHFGHDAVPATYFLNTTSILVGIKANTSAFANDVLADIGQWFGGLFSGASP